MHIMDSIDLNLSEIVTHLVGQNVWQVRLGHGSFITMEFGKPVTGKSVTTTHGEWQLWIYLCSWRIERNGQVLAACEDSRDVMAAGVELIEGGKLLSFDVYHPALDAKLCFDNGIVLRLFSIFSEHSDDGYTQHWKLFMPCNRVLLAGPGSKWVIKASNQ